MPGASTKKRSHDERAARPSKKQKRAALKRAQSDDESDSFQAVNLLDSDEEDIHTAVVDDGASDNGASSSDDNGTRQRIKKPSKAKKTSIAKTPAAAAKPKPKEKPATTDDGSEADDNESDGDDDSEDDSEGSDSAGEKQQNTKSKRNDPSAFSTSISKILSTKLPSSRRADPVLARSASANDNARAAADAALEAKAKRHIKLQRKEALEKGRVKDVLEVSQNESAVAAGGEGNTAMEMRLRKVAQRGVVRLFNAVRASQVKAAEAERAAKKEGIIGHTTKEAKVNEMSKKGFLDLIASGGGGLKKGALEES
ncbi:ribosomal RNA-processing protein [Plectosphaerella cucumerina]|uniref:Ribosomal RNA-processing protein n=1 Tax=Plectosphaerella cucumerina TaxID=40658 RepID=A0A8K0X855_9PEZI|nr:ribosomal RNA-processing protein [Plectosphaerella cucumerina]